MSRPENSRGIARTLARFHRLEIPFTKEPRWLYETTMRNIKRIESDIGFDEPKDLEKFEKIKSFNLKNEFLKLMYI